MRDHPVRSALAAGTGAGLGVILASVTGIYNFGSGNGERVEATTPAPHVFKVVGTCAAGACGLTEHTEPNSYSKELGRLPDGRSVRVLCQEAGVTLTIHDGGAEGGVTRDNVWDKVTDHSAPEGAAFVNDFYVSAPGEHFSPDLPRC